MSKRTQREIEALIEKKTVLKTPVFSKGLTDPIEIDLEIIKALNWYNEMATEKKEFQWTMAYLKGTGKFTEDQILKIEEFDHRMFERVGRYCRMISDGFPIESWAVPCYIQPCIQKIYKKLIKNSNAAARGETTPAVPEQTRLDRSDEMIDKILVILDSYLFKIHENKKDNDSKFFDVKSFIISNQIGPNIASKIHTHLSAEADYYTRALQDSKVREYYSHYTTEELKRIVSIYKNICEALQSRSVERKERKPRQRKEKAPSELVKNVQYLSETNDFGGLKSVHPQKIVGSSKVIVLNTKYREYSIYEATDGKGLSVKGTTILYFDEKKSISKRIREKYLTDLVAKTSQEGIRGIRKALGDIKSKEDVPTGRLNKECIILKVI